MENKNWEKVSNNTWKNLNNGEIEHAFDFKIDLDNYESISCVPGLTEYIRNEVRSEQLQDKLNIRSLKSSFKKWRNLN